jgi:S1-C subfamily serine protease
VLAIGNPFGLDRTLTSGIISGVGRDIRSIGGATIKGVVQTDASINPGNSGGPLLDSQGRLIGVNTAIYSPSGASAGVGFAIPVDTVRRVVNELIRKGKVSRPGLGVMCASDSQAKQLGVNGVLILGLSDDGAAAKAGLLRESLLHTLFALIMHTGVVKEMLTLFGCVFVQLRSEIFWVESNLEM